ASCLLNRRHGERRHDGVSRLVGVQTIVRKLALEKSSVVYHAVKIVEINKSIGRGIIFQPGVQLQNLVWVALLEERLALRRVVMYRKHGCKDHPNVTYTRQLSH